MGVFDRFKDIMSSNVNALLDKMEDPAKMVDQYLRNAKRDLAEVKQSTAKIMAEETRARRALEENTKEIAKFEQLAHKAVDAGEEGDALVFLEEQSKLEAHRDTLEKTFQLANNNATMARDLHNKLANDVQLLESKRNSIKAKMEVTKTQQVVNKMTSNTGKMGRQAGKFDDLSEKVDAQLDTALAESQLNASMDNGVGDLASKYMTGSSSAQDKLAKLKAARAGN